MGNAHFVGIARRKGNQLEMPQGFEAADAYEVLEFDGNLTLLSKPQDRHHFATVERLVKQSIEDHRKTLEGLA